MTKKKTFVFNIRPSRRIRHKTNQKSLIFFIFSTAINYDVDE